MENIPCDILGPIFGTNSVSKKPNVKSVINSIKKESTGSALSNKVEKLCTKIIANYFSAVLNNVSKKSFLTTPNVENKF